VALALLLVLGVGLRSYRHALVDIRLELLASEADRAALMLPGLTGCAELACLSKPTSAAEAAEALSATLGRDVELYLESGTGPALAGIANGPGRLRPVAVPVPETLPRTALPRSAFAALRAQFADTLLGRGAPPAQPGLLDMAGSQRAGLNAEAYGRLGAYAASSIALSGRRATVVLRDHGIDPLDENLRQALLPSALFILAAASAIGFALTAKLTQPLRILTNAAERVRSQAGMAGSIRLPDFDGRGDDVGRLSRSFRAMMAALVDRIESIDNFAADVSHELKNPLTSIKSAVETLDKCKTPEQRERLLKVIANDVQRMDRLISDISGASRMDAQLATEARHPVSASKLLQDIAVGYNAVVEAGGPKVSFQDLTGGREAIYAAPAALGRVFRNLVDNAISFSPPGGEVRMLLEHADADGMILVTVTDEGPGVPPDNLETIFDRFYTSRPSGTTFGANSGLGLAIAKQIVESHGGSIWAQNVRDDEGEAADAKGARFTVALPTCGRRSV
jgi:signal transduction histidine kinase